MLDLGTGIGEPAATAARRVGPTGRVLGIDLAPWMIEVGRRRVQRLGLDNLDLQVGDADSLDLAETSFDAVLSRWALMLLEDLGGALARLRRLLVSGGRLAVGLWGEPARVPMISVPMAVAAEMLHLPPPPPNAPRHLWEHGTDSLERLAREAGFTDVTSESLDLLFEFPSPKAAAGFVSRMAGPLRILSEHQPPSLSHRLLDAIDEALQPFRRPDGTVALVNETLVLTGRRPEAESAGGAQAA